MKNKQPNSAGNYNFLALVFSVFALIATLLLAVARGLANAGIATVADPNLLTNWMYVSIALIVVGIAGYFILEPDKVRRFITGRQARHGSNSLVMTIAFLGILGVANVLAIQNPLPEPIDLTTDKENTLSEQMLTAAKNLPSEIEATAYFSTGADTTGAKDLLDSIKAASDGKFSYEFVDPNANPQAAIADGITADGSIVLHMGERSAVADFAGETQILTALTRLIGSEGNTVYFITGHGEHNIEPGGQQGNFTRIRGFLEGSSYTVKSLNLIADQNIPEDATVIVIGGPNKPVSAQEVKILKQYVENGGALIVMENPTIVTEFGDAADPLADYLAEDWGISLDQNVVVDLNTQAGSIAVGSTYDPSHPITSTLIGNITVFPFSRSVSNISEIEGITKTAVASTNENSWGETDFESLNQGGQVGLDEGIDTPGPLTLVMAGENINTSARVVVFGNSLFAIDASGQDNIGADTYSNGDLFVNAVNWAANEEELVNISTKTTTQRTFVPPTSFSSIVIWLSGIIIIPGMVVLLGIATWISRRRQG